MAGVAALSLSGVRTGVEHAASAIEAGVSEGAYEPYATQRQMDRTNRRQQQQEDLAKRQQELEEELKGLQEELDEQEDSSSRSFFANLFGADPGAAPAEPVTEGRARAYSRWYAARDDD